MSVPVIMVKLQSGGNLVWYARRESKKGPMFTSVHLPPHPRQFCSVTPLMSSWPRPSSPWLTSSHSLSPLSPVDLLYPFNLLLQMSPTDISVTRTPQCIFTCRECLQQQQHRDVRLQTRRIYHESWQRMMWKYVRKVGPRRQINARAMGCLLLPDGREQERERESFRASREDGISLVLEVCLTQFRPWLNLHCSPSSPPALMRGTKKKAVASVDAELHENRYIGRLSLAEFAWGRRVRPALCSSPVDSRWCSIGRRLRPTSSRFQAAGRWQREMR